MALTFGSSLETHTRRTDTATEIRVSGDLDLGSVGALEAAVLAAFEERPARLVIDLSAVSFMDSTGVHLLERMKRDGTERGIACTAVAPTGPARRVFAISGRESLVTPSPSRGALRLVTGAGL